MRLGQARHDLNSWSDSFVESTHPVGKRKGQLIAIYGFEGLYMLGVFPCVRVGSYSLKDCVYESFQWVKNLIVIGNNIT